MNTNPNDNDLATMRLPLAKKSIPTTLILLRRCFLTTMTMKMTGNGSMLPPSAPVRSRQWFLAWLKIWCRYIPIRQTQMSLKSVTSSCRLLTALESSKCRRQHTLQGIHQQVEEDIFSQSECGPFCKGDLCSEI